MNKRDTMAAAVRGEGCLGKSQDNEPVFTLVARDKLAAATVRAWAGMVADHGGPTAKTTAAFELADQMDAWREAHGGGKVPD